jgi:dephospho-CoA kinase
VNPHGLRKFIEAGYNVVAIEIYRNERDRMLSYLQRDKNANVQELFDRYKRDEEDFEDLMSDYIVFNDGTIEDGVQQLETIIKEELFFQFIDGEVDKI